jgi:hypothetical protein
VIRDGPVQALAQDMPCLLVADLNHYNQDKSYL